MSTQRIAASLIVLIACALTWGASPARAYEYSTCGFRWPTSSVTYRPSTISFPSGSSWRAALERMRAAWIYAPGSAFRPLLSYTSATHWASGNGVNEVAFSSAYASNGALAVTIKRAPWCLYIQEADIVFNSSLAWNPSTQPSPMDTRYSIVLAGVHEFGHSFGLGHENDEMATMGAYYPFAGTLGAQSDPDPHADDVAGVRKLYGSSMTTDRDVSLSIYRRAGAGTTERILQPSILRIGQSAYVTVTVGNRGEVAEDVVVNAYASTDSWITSADVRIGGLAIALPGVPAGSEGTYTLLISIPRTLPPGRYYLGFIADPFRSIPETDEDNNAVRHIQAVTVW